MYKAVEVARPAAVPPPYKQTPKDQLPTTNGVKIEEPRTKSETNNEYRTNENVSKASPNPQVLSPNPSPSPTPTPSTPHPSGPLIAADHGIVISLDTTVSQELLLEGVARDIIRSVRNCAKTAAAFTDSITLTVSGADDVLAVYKDLIARETRSAFGTVTGEAHPADIEGRTITLQFSKN